MDWIAGIQKAIDYTEAHLTEEIDYEAAAKEGYSSSFHFQSVFSMLCGFTLGDYSRMRRLSLAASGAVKKVSFFQKFSRQSHGKSRFYWGLLCKVFSFVRLFLQPH